MANENLEALTGGVAKGGTHGHQARHITVVIGAEHNDVALESALALVEVVGQIGRNVGGVSVALDDDAIFVVTKCRGAQPHRTVFVKDVTELAQA